MSERIARSEWRALPAERKAMIDGRPHVLRWTDQGTALVPVEIVGIREYVERGLADRAAERAANGGGDTDPFAGL